MGRIEVGQVEIKRFIGKRQRSTCQLFVIQILAEVEIGIFAQLGGCLRESLIAPGGQERTHHPQPLTNLCGYIMEAPVLKEDAIALPGLEAVEGEEIDEICAQVCDTGGSHFINTRSGIDQHNCGLMLLLQLLDHAQQAF